MKAEWIVSLIAVISVIIMGLVILVAILYPAGLGGSSAHTVTVTATGSAGAQPQQATLYLSVNGTGASAQVATANISLTLAEVNSTLLKYVNQNSSEIKSTFLSISRPYNSSAYEAQEDIQVMLGNIQNVSPAISALATIKNVYVSDAASQLSNSQVNSLRAQALTAALANATSQARSVVGQNATLNAGNMTIDSFTIYPAFGAAATGSVPVFFVGTDDVTESVTVTFTYSN